MKEKHRAEARREVKAYNGYIFASTWLQCAPTEGVGGPFFKPGGYSKNMDVDKNIDQLHPDAGIKWWLEFVRDTYGAWSPPFAGS